MYLINVFSITDDTLRFYLHVKDKCIQITLASWMGTMLSVMTCPVAIFMVILYDDGTDLSTALAPSLLSPFTNHRNYGGRIFVLSPTTGLSFNII